MTKLISPVSHDHLARMIDGNWPHVSTIMTKFKKRVWIQYQGRKLLINTGALSRATSPPQSGDRFLTLGQLSVAARSPGRKQSVKIGAEESFSFLLRNPEIVQNRQLRS